MSGWYSVKRGMLDHELFAPVGKWSRAEAWLWMIEAAAMSETVIDIGGKPFTVQRGCLCFSLRFLAAKWRWGVKAVRCFLAKLEAHNAIQVSMVGPKKGTKEGTGRTHIRLCNYDKYQTPGHSKGTARAQQGHKEEQVTSSVAKATAADAAPDPTKVLFDSGKDYLSAATGKSKDAMGRMLGLWRKDYGTEAVIVALGRAQREGAIDPVAFITASLKASKAKTGGDDQFGAFGKIRSVG